MAGDEHPAAALASPGPVPGPVPVFSPGPVPVVFLIADTGGGHRTAARAVSQALGQRYPGRFAPVFCDPLGGPRSSWLLRWVTGLYDPSIRLARPAWAVAYY